MKRRTEPHVVESHAARAKSRIGGPVVRSLAADTVDEMWECQRGSQK